MVVTGISMITANGDNKEEFVEQAQSGRGGIRKTDLFPTDRLRTDYFGQVKGQFAYEVEQEDQASRLECIFDHLTQQLLADADLTAAGFSEQNERACFSFATSVGANDYITAHVKGSILNSISKSNIYKLPVKMGIKGPVFVNTSACAAGTTAIGTAFSMVKSGVADIAVAGGVDPLTEFSSYGFHSLQSLSGSPCKPFDKNRDGITLGEGGALFVVEEYEAALKRGAHIYGEILGYGLGNDAYHATSPDPSGQGAYRVMSQALNQAGIEAEAVDYVNAHGTGTRINDSMEVKAIEALGCKCSVTSTKSQTGHCLAAAGAIEFAAAILSMTHERIFPNVNLEEEIESEGNIQFVRGQSLHRELNYVLSNSFAFAGNAASIVVGRYVDG